MSRRPLSAAVFAAVLMPGFTATAALAYDMDCAVILCMAGGFPGSECQPPYQYMIERITPFPSLPPFGVCSDASGKPAIDYQAPQYAWIHRSRILWYDLIPDDHRLDWRVRSCTLDDQCTLIARGSIRSGFPDIALTSENGLEIAVRGNIWRAVAIEYLDHEHKPRFSGWYSY